MGIEPTVERDAGAVAEMSRAVARARDPHAIARTLLDGVCELLGIPFAGLALVDDDAGRARGFLAVRDAEEVDWWPRVDLELDEETSAIAVTAAEAAPMSIPDVESSPIVHRGLAEAVGAVSAAFVPTFSDERVIGVIALATTRERHEFAASELALVQALAGEAGLALERARSDAALAEALERERLVASIGRQVRSELDVDAVLRIAITEIGAALEVARCFIRLGAPGEPMPIRAEWLAPGVETIGRASDRLAVSNLAARELRTVAIADVATARELDDPSLGRRESLLGLGTRAALATPIVVFDRLIGVFGLHRNETWDWSVGEIALAEAVAREVGVAVHAAQLLAENRERLRHQQALVKAAQAVTSELHLEAVLDRLVTELTNLLEADAADCHLLDGERAVTRCAAVHGLDPSLIGWEAPADRGLRGEALRSGQAVLADEHPELRHEDPHPAYEGFADAVVAPMTWAGEVRGTVGVGTRDATRDYGRADAEAVEVFASLAALALRNAESFEQSVRQARVERGFYRIASVLSEPLSLAETVEAIAHAASEALGGDAAAVLMPGPAGLVVAGSHRLPASVSDLLSEGLPESAEILAAFARERRVLASRDVSADDRFEHEWRAAAAGNFASMLALPLEHRGQGGLVLVFFPTEHAFTDDDLELAGHLSRAARGALERSDLYEAERTAHALARQLARTGSRLAVELDPEAVIAEVVQEAPALVGAEAAAIWELDGDELVLRAAAGERAESAARHRLRGTARPVGDVVQSGAPVAVTAAGDDPTLRADPVLAAGYEAAVGVPLVGPERGLHGVLAVYADAPRDWRPDEIQALEALAGNASAALANAELYQRVALEKDRSEAILASIADGIVALDRDGEVVLWNRAAEGITGVPAGEALGRTPEEVLQRTLTGDGTRLIPIQRGGEEVWLSVTESVMRDPLGEVAGRVFAFRDVSAERAVEQLKSDFVSSVSHELRAPLTSIFGFAETLLRREGLFDEDERRTFLRYIASESERLTGIVDQLLNVARLEAGDLEVELTPVDLVGAVRNAVERAERLARSAGGDGGGRFAVAAPSAPLLVQADPDKLRLVLANLVDNAVRYSPAGATVTISVEERPDTAEVAVADEGVGIAPAEQELIFHKFYRGAEQRGREASATGAGLGLFIARGLVRAMGGQLWLASADGGGAGTVFAFSLPRAREAT
jgi:two-component system phosphate regulon sensor histidine kinase PhoR